MGGCWLKRRGICSSGGRKLGIDEQASLLAIGTVASKMFGWLLFAHSAFAIGDSMDPAIQASVRMCFVPCRR